MPAKFQLKRLSSTTQMTDETRARYTNHINTLPDGDYEIIVRKAVKWDVARMRKYFHGPVLGFIVEQFKITGNVFGKTEVKEFLKKEFGQSYIVSMASVSRCFLRSTSSYTFEDYTKFLNDINAWCIECFGYELPPSDEVE